MGPDEGTLPALPDDWDCALILVAHLDDIEYGAGAAVAAWTAEGKTVTYVIASSGEAGLDGVAPDEAGPIRRAEQVAAAAAVGVDDVTFLDHPDGLIEYGVKLRRDLAAAIRRARPQLIVTLTGRLRVGDAVNHPDHRAVALAVLDAVRDAANRWLWPTDGPPWDGVHHVAAAASPCPTHAVDVGGHLDAAVASLGAHRAYLAATGTDAEAAVAAQASSGGRRAGTTAAVVFEVVDFR